MAYVERGVVKPKRSIWRLRTITYYFWSIIDFIRIFFATLFSMEKSDAYKKSGKSSGRPGGPGGGGPYGGGGGGGGSGGSGPRRPLSGLDNVRGIDHSSLPACGSCCG